MSKIVVDLKNNKAEAKAPDFSKYQNTEAGSVLGKVFKVFAGIVLVALILGTVGGFFYWRYLKTTPQYSLALLVDAARRDDQKAIDTVVDVDAVVDDFVPQVTDKAIELYARGVEPGLIKRAMALATPVLPVIKQRAKAELPGLIREKTKKFEDIPFWAIAIGADRYLDIKQIGDKAIIKSKLANRPLEVEMKRNGNKWQIVALKDEKLARRIADKIGQEVIGLAKNRGTDQLEKLGKDLGIDNVDDLLKKAQDIFK